MKGDPSAPLLTEPERLNLLVVALQEGWGWLPLSVRYDAARAADDLIVKWHK